MYQQTFYAEYAMVATSDVSLATALGMMASRVNEEMKDRWQPFGTHVITHNTRLGRYTVSQAVVRHTWQGPQE